MKTPILATTANLIANWQLLTTFTSSLYIASLVASLFASSVTRVFGRKPSIHLGGAAFFAGSALGGAALNVYKLIFGRILLGIGVGFANQSVRPPVPLYLSEKAPPKYTGAINIGFQLSIVIGFLLANLINFGTEKIKSGWGWRISLAMAAAPASILTLRSLFLPETPNSQIQNGKDCEKAKLMLQRVRGTNDVQAELDDLIKLSESDSLLSAVVTGVVGTVSTFISMLIVYKLGRRALFMIGGIQIFLSQIMVGLIAAQLGDHGGISKGYASLIIIFICTYVTGFAWSWGPLGWLVPSEIFPLEIRSAGQSITVAVSSLFLFISAQTFLTMLYHFKSGISFFFGGWVMVMAAFVYFLSPETKNMPIEQMTKGWREQWFWKRIVGDVRIFLMVD
uniref:Major facilitator superfamily (MFS) profile domain-containing protein n=1 Tax=Quercus lobata TaxID=97700 RepID=A0A7N2MJR0_QUELO